MLLSKYFDRRSPKNSVGKIFIKGGLQILLWLFCFPLNQQGKKDPHNCSLRESWNLASHPEMQSTQVMWAGFPSYGFGFMIPAVVFPPQSVTLLAPWGKDTGSACQQPARASTEISSGSSLVAPDLLSLKPRTGSPFGHPVTEPASPPRRGHGSTCPIRRAADEGGQHFHFGSVVSLLLQPRFHLRSHPLLHLQQLLVGELELGQGLVDEAVLLWQPVGHGRHHGRSLPAAALRQQEPHLRVGHQAPRGLVQAPGVPAGRGGCKPGLCTAQSKICTASPQNLCCMPPRICTALPQNLHCQHQPNARGLGKITMLKLTTACQGG